MKAATSGFPDMVLWQDPEAVLSGADSNSEIQEPSSVDMVANNGPNLGAKMLIKKQRTGNFRNVI